MSKPLENSVNPIRSKDIRESNEKLILRLIREGEGVSQSEVVALTGLRAPTVLRFFTHLEAQGFIQQATREPEKDKRGRKPVYYEPVPDAAYAMGLEFWAQTASVCVLDFAGKEVFSRTWSMKQDDRGDVLRFLEDKFQESLKDSGLPKERFLGLCVAAPGQVDVETGELIQYSRLGIADINLRTALEDSLNLPVLVQNNAAAVAWDEYTRGTGKEARSLFSLMIRAGVGGAFLDDGEIFVTKSHTTLEIGHISVEYDGRLCDCGSRGCLETYLSEGAILEDLAQVVTLQSLEDLEDLLQNPSENLRMVLDEKAGLLAQAIRNLISLFGPDMFLIVTRFEALGDYLADRVRENLVVSASRRWQGETQVASALYKPLRAGRGAADLMYRKFFAT